jgi:hypothetical protein
LDNLFVALGQNLASKSNSIIIIRINRTALSCSLKTCRLIPETDATGVQHYNNDDYKPHFESIHFDDTILKKTELLGFK